MPTFHSQFKLRPKSHCEWRPFVHGLAPLQLTCELLSSFFRFTTCTPHPPLDPVTTCVGACVSHLVGALWAERNEVPKHVGILEMGPWVPLLSVDKVGKLQGNGNGSGHISQCKRTYRKQLQYHSLHYTTHAHAHTHTTCTTLTRRGSLMKKMGVLLPTRSQFPSSV